MQQENVFKVITGERNHQDKKWGTIESRPREVGTYLTLMRKLLTDAERAYAESSGDEAALHEIRKVISTGVACAEQHGLPERKS